MLRFVFTFLICLYFLATRSQKHKCSNLKRDGYVVFNDASPTPQKRALSLLPPGYAFLDYSYEIKGCSLSTYHRDVTSSQRVMKCKHPTYTLIVYLYEGNHLSIIPGSHKSHPLAFTSARNISGKKYNCVLFDADCVHAGMPNKVGRRRHVMQYKIAHIDDLDCLKSLHGKHVSKVGDCDGKNKLKSFILRQISYHFSFVVSLFDAPLQMRRTGIIGTLQKATGIDFYN